MFEWVGIILFDEERVVRSTVVDALILFQAETVEGVVGLFGGSESVGPEGAILLEEERIDEES